ncbi:hypothetical protein [Undibacterium sp.]|uniref:hypothetical protein n=1 Tax=Undibacterium sp. TaxID=1914977 RepID=UPI00374CA715
MFNLVVEIERFVDNDFPGFVECSLVDAGGVRHEFVEKVPVVSSANLRDDSTYLQSGYIGCIIENERIDKLGRHLMQVDTNQPWGIESIVGETRFEVLAEQIVSD